MRIEIAIEIGITTTGTAKGIGMRIESGIVGREETGIEKGNAIGIAEGRSMTLRAALMTMRPAISTVGTITSDYVYQGIILSQHQLYLGQYFIGKLLVNGVFFLITWRLICNFLSDLQGFRCGLNVMGQYALEEHII